MPRDFNYTGPEGDKGLNYIFKVKEDGLEGKKIDLNNAKSVFDDIQKEERNQGESLFLSKTDKTKVQESVEKTIAEAPSSPTVKPVDFVIPVSEEKTDSLTAGIVKINTPNATGSYQISETNGGKGYKIKQQIKTVGQPVASELFQKFTKNTETGEYSIRSIKGKNIDVVIMQAQMKATKLSVDNEIYKDIISKQVLGKEPSKAEKMFMEDHLKELQINGLQLDEKYQIVEITSQK